MDEPLKSVLHGQCDARPTVRVRDRIEIGRIDIWRVELRNEKEPRGVGQTNIFWAEVTAAKN